MPSPHHPASRRARSSTGSRRRAPAQSRTAPEKPESELVWNGTRWVRTPKVHAPRPARRRRRRPPPDPNDPGVRRRARKKREGRRTMLLALSLLALGTTILGGMALGIWQDLDSSRERVAAREDRLKPLRVELWHRQNELRALASPAGQQRALIKNGFVREGERLLLFPDPDERPE